MLACLLRLQSLDRFDVEIIYPLWLRVCREQPPAEHVPEWLTDGRVTLAELEAALDAAQGNACSPEALQARLQQVPRQLGLSVLRAYLLAAMAKDCSIMLSIAPCDPAVPLPVPSVDSSAGRDLSLHELGPWLQSCVPVRRFVCKGQAFCYSLAVVDTERKPAAKVVQHWQLDREILAQTCGV